MAITNPEVIRYCNETLRPLAERFRDMDAINDAALVEYFNTISVNVPNDPAEILEDGREAEGVSRLSGADITNFVTQMQAYQTQLNGAGVMNVIEKPTVRPLEVV